MVCVRMVRLVPPCTAHETKLFAAPTYTLETAVPSTLPKGTYATLAATDKLALPTIMNPQSSSAHAARMMPS